MDEAVERLARALHNANAAELAARGMPSVEFPVDGRMEQEVVADWEDVAEPVQGLLAGGRGAAVAAVHEDGRRGDRGVRTFGHRGGMTQLVVMTEAAAERLGRDARLGRLLTGVLG